MRVIEAVLMSMFFVSYMCAQHLAMQQFVLAEELDLTEFGGRVALCPAPLSAHNNSCTCPAGWTWLGGACTMCAAGLYKSESGFGPCTACPAHMTSYEGAVDVSECMCGKGYMPGSNSCVPCSSMTYKAFIGNHSRVSCPEHAKSSTGATDMADCVCHDGWTFENNNCVPCPDNHFSGSSTAGRCVPGPAHSASHSPASVCQCIAGSQDMQDSMTMHAHLVCPAHTGNRCQFLTVSVSIVLNICRRAEAQKTLLSACLKQVMNDRIKMMMPFICSCRNNK
jgi:hypothetical protein